MAAIRGSIVADGDVRNGLPDLSGHAAAAPRVRVSFWCASRHHTMPSFAADARIPELWECPRCGLPAGPDEANPPPPPRTEPYKRPLAYLKDRRSDSDGAAILAAALARAEAARRQPALPSTEGEQVQRTPQRSQRPRAKTETPTGNAAPAAARPQQNRPQRNDLAAASPSAQTAAAGRRHHSAPRPVESELPPAGAETLRALAPATVRAGATAGASVRAMSVHERRAPASTRLGAEPARCRRRGCGYLVSQCRCRQGPLL